MANKNGAEFTNYNADHFGCVDGRPVLFILEMIDGEYKITFDSKKTEDLNYPQLLGAALGFVAAVETQLGLDMKEAFDLVDRAFKTMNFKPSIHVDDHHGERASEFNKQYKRILFRSKNRKELVQKILKLIKGCGFAAYQWEDKADLYIEEAIERGWLIQVLTGEHEEHRGGAFVNKRVEESLDVVAANKKEQPAFNYDFAPVLAMLQAIEELAKEDKNSRASNFVHSSSEWLLENYATVVVSLGGVKDMSEIVTVD